MDTILAQHFVSYFLDMKLFSCIFSINDQNFECYNLSYKRDTEVRIYSYVNKARVLYVQIMLSMVLQFLRQNNSVETRQTCSMCLWNILSIKKLHLVDTYTDQTHM